MKKIIIIIGLLLFCLSLGCCKQNQDNLLNLYVETFEVDQTLYEFVCEEYSIDYSQLYYVIDNYDTYLELYPLLSKKEIEPLDKEGQEKMFLDKVIICYPRVVSYSRKFIPIKCSFDKETNQIVRTNIYEPSNNVNFPCVVVAYCFDIVEVPKDIYNNFIDK